MMTIRSDRPRVFLSEYKTFGDYLNTSDIREDISELLITLNEYLNPFLARNQ